MSRYSSLRSSLAAVFLTYSACSFAQLDDDEIKIRRLENTVEQLTLQLAKTIEERNRLRNALLQNFTTRYSASRDQFGCDATAAAEYIRNHTYREGIALGLWLEENGRGMDCTRDQLENFRRTYELRSGDLAKRIIDTEIGAPGP